MSFCPCDTYCTARVHATHAHTSAHVGIRIYTRAKARAHIHYSSRAPRRVEYTRTIGRAPTRITIAFTRHPTVAVLKCRNPKSVARTVCASIGATGCPRSANSQHQSPQPLLDGRNSIASTTRATFERRTRLRSRIARGTVAPAIFRPGDLLHTRCRRLHRFHHRWCNHSFRRRRLKIGRVDHWHARHLACVHASVTMIGCDPSRPDTQGRGSCRQTRRTAGVTVAPARAIAPSRTTPVCAPRPLLGRCPGPCHFRGPGSGSGRPRKAARRLGLCHTCQEARAKSNVQVHRRRSAASC